MTKPGATPARRAAYEVVRRTFEHDAWTDRVFPAAAERHGLTGRDRAQAQRLAYGAVARKGTTDRLVALLAGRKARGFDPPVVAALRLGMYEILYSEAAPHAAVGEAVELAKGGMRKSGPRRALGAAGLVNALLRRAAAEREDLLAQLTDATATEAAICHSVPEWLAGMWWSELGEGQARSLLRAINEPIETAMRANTLAVDPAALRSELQEAGEPLRPPGQHPLLDPPEAMVWDGPLGPPAHAALERGAMFAQSRGAQAVVGLLGVRPGDTVLDLCAGPGVKTTALAAIAGSAGGVVAVEVDPARARQVEELSRRAGASAVRVKTADVAAEAFRPPELEGGRGYDRVLADPPCSDLGTLASRPDARWRKEADSVAGLALVQTAILDNAIASLAPGGTLVYSTCTISSHENERTVSAALERHDDLALDATLETRPDRDGTDGFYAARLVRSRG